MKQEHEEREMLQAQLTDRERELKEVQEQLEALKKSDMEVRTCMYNCMPMYCGIFTCTGAVSVAGEHAIGAGTVE